MYHLSNDISKVRHIGNIEAILPPIPWHPFVFFNLLYFKADTEPKLRCMYHTYKYRNRIKSGFRLSVYRIGSTINSRDTILVRVT